MFTVFFPQKGRTFFDYPVLSVVLLFMVYALVLLPVVHLILYAFFLLRGTWTLRVTPGALLIKTWFRTVRLPWKMITAFSDPDGPTYGLPGRQIIPFPSLDICFVPDEDLKKILTWSMRVSFSVWKGKIRISPRWLSIKPCDLVPILQKYRHMFFGYDDGQPEDCV
ncbi:MAG: hypothetical protein ACYS8W_00750 [Planctomycetota bacterium]